MKIEEPARPRAATGPARGRASLLVTNSIFKGASWAKFKLSGHLSIETWESKLQPGSGGFDVALAKAEKRQIPKFEVK